MQRKRFQAILMTLLFSGLSIAAGCASMHSILKGVGFQDPTITCREVQVSEVSLKGVRLEFLFDVTNPNPAGFTIAELDYVLQSDRPDPPSLGRPAGLFKYL